MGRAKKNTAGGYDSPFAARLRELMETPDISQAKVAEPVGVTRQAISSYSLGTSVPDIDKLVRIAEFFDVSTEFLLGRTEIKKVDATKQAAAEYLDLSEEAIDAIRLLKYGHMEQNFLDGFKLTTQMEPLADMLSSWIEAVDLSKLLSDLYRVVRVCMEYSQSGKHPERYELDAKDKKAIWDVQDMGYVVLSLSEQLDFYMQSAAEVFRKSVDRLLDEAIKAAGKENDAGE
jgi:transcriptional regulator with XRE-family HTH domain